MTYVIVDFEATCCNRGSVPRDEMEIIEIGAVALEHHGPDIQGEFQSFIRPVRHPELTEFCTQLTSITQSDVDGAQKFELVLADFSSWLAQYEDVVFCSWGNYDRRQLHQDCAFHEVAYPFDKRHINIKKRFADNKNVRPMGLGRALKFMKMTFEGTAHRGIDDAKNMARLGRHIFI